MCTVLCNVFLRLSARRRNFQPVSYFRNAWLRSSEHTIRNVGNSPLQHARKWTAIVCAVVCAHVVLSLLAPRGFALTAFGDLLQTILLVCATVISLSNVRAAGKKARLFWVLLGLGMGLWLCSQALWSYFEVFLRHEAPNPFVGDVVLFLHIVPIMAAVAVQPHMRHDDRALRLGMLDFLLLLTWWLFLYLFVVIPWQYVHPVESLYGHSFDILYLVEQVVLIVGLILVWRWSRGEWRRVYAHLFGAVLLYSIASFSASEAIDSHIYYTGSLFDVPLVAAMVWFVRIGFLAREVTIQQSAEEIPAQGYGL